MSNIIIATTSYVLLPLLLLNKAYFNYESPMLLDKKSSTCLKGLLSIYLIIHHFVQLMENKWLISPLAWIGWFIVGWFFITSGYGLTCGGGEKALLDQAHKKTLGSVFVCGIDHRRN